MAITRIMVPTDGSESSVRAVAFAAQAAAAFGAAVEIVTVMDPGQLDFFEAIEFGAEGDASWNARIQETILAPALSCIDEQGQSVSTRILKGSVYKTLLQHINDSQPDLVVLGRTQRGTVNRMLNGSVSHRLLANSPVPITLVN